MTARTVNGRSWDDMKKRLDDLTHAAKDYPDPKDGIFCLAEAVDILLTWVDELINEGGT